MINSKLLTLKKKKENNKNNQCNLKTINGVQKTCGLTKLKIKIFNIEKLVYCHVIDREDFKYDFLIGLDLIREFNLTQDENLKISQREEKNFKRSFTSGDVVSNYEQKDKNDSNKHSINFNEHIKQTEFKINNDNLSEEQKREIKNLIDKHRKVFAKDKYDIGTVKDYEARIDLLEDKYCSKRPYRCSIEDKKEIEQQVAKLLENKLIEESYSPFAAPVTLAFKREENRRSRLCIDFRDLNKIVVPQAQPFPLIEDIMAKTRNCKYFTNLDINSAFWSIPLRIEDRNKTGFITQDGHWQWTCMPFGLKTSPAIFQRILSNILRKYKLTEFAVNYIDDILIFSKTFDEHVQHLTKLLKAIEREGFRLKFTKCNFASDWVKYLGHIIQNNTIRPIKDNLIAIKNFPIPKTQKNIRQFLGKINFYHEYIPKGALILDPLHNLLRKNIRFDWSEKCQEALDKIKDLLCSQPILEIFDNELPIKIYTDASLQGVGATLKQIQVDGKEKPIAYFSKKLNETQKRRKAIYLECLAIKEAIQYWQYWLIGKHFTVITDHKPLENLNIRSRPDEELGDLTYYLSQYDFDIKYSPGKDNVEADCLSRNPVLESNENNDEQLKVVNLITLEDIINDQRHNQDLQQKRIKLKAIDQIYYKKNAKSEKIMISEDLSKRLIKQVHESMCHPGIRQTQKKISATYTAKNLTANIKKWIDSCEICIKNKSRGTRKFGLMAHLGPATKPFEIVSIDTIGGFGGSRSTKKYLHLLVDHFTRYAYIITSKTQMSNDFIKLVNNTNETEQINTLLTDQYPGINSKEFKNFLKENSITMIFTAVNSPFSNGLNERLNQTLVNKIRCKINEAKKKRAWTTIAQECVKKYNETEHTVTGFAPKYLLDGTNVAILPNELKKKKPREDWLADRQTALKNTIRSHKYNKQLFDKNRKQHEFGKGDLVYVENGNRLNRKKLDELKIGPFQILEKISDSIYKINTGHRKSESNLFHITKLIPIEEGKSKEEEEESAEDEEEEEGEVEELEENLYLELL